MIGSAAGMCVDRADVPEEAEVYKHTRRGRPPTKEAATARPKDKVPAGTCAGCGFVAEHRKPADCIEFLRDLLAERSGVDLAQLATEPKKRRHVNYR